MGENTQLLYHRIYFEAHGSLPLPCERCDDLVESMKFGSKRPGCIHHIDLNHKNNALENLMLLHLTCHRQLHEELQPRTAEHSANIAKSRTPEVRAKISIGVKKTLWKKIKCPDCDMIAYPGPLGGHRKATGH